MCAMPADIYLDGTYSRRNPSYHTEDSAWKAQQIYKAIERNKLQPRTVCEIGCGAGEILSRLQVFLPAETQLCGYEISPDAFALCESRRNDRLRFFCEDLLSKDGEVFDLLLCIDVFEHVDDYLGFLRRLRSKSRHKIFHVPLDLSVQAVWRRLPILESRAQVGHLHYFMMDTALATLRDTGYEILEYSYTAADVDLPKSFKARLAALPRRMLAGVSPDWTARVLGGYSLLVVAR
jgi:hypothetical protein